MRTGSVSNSGVTQHYNAYGMCVTYNTKRYCWDDGIITVPAFVGGDGVTYGPYTFTYFGIDKNPSASGYRNCNSFCANDPFSVPQVETVQVDSMIPVSTLNLIQLNGMPNRNICYEANGYLVCTDFTIDLNQVGL
jgi:hypothetical protein